MPRFFFHIQTRNGFVEDVEGEECSTLDDARQSALLGAREIMSDKVLKGQDPFKGSISIVDEAGKTLMVVPFRYAVDE